MKKFLLSVLALMTFPTIGAEVISPDIALARAVGSTRSYGGSENYVLLNTVKTGAGDAAVYLFTDGSRSLILSADDSTPCVLGILDSAIPESIENAEFNYWMDKYAAEIEWQRNNPVVPQTRSDETPTKDAIGPLLTTTWDQVSPFNDLSPVVNGEKSWAGCVATAMSQVINYHEWPEKGKGSNRYLATTAKKEFSCDFSNITFDWANMLDSYKGTSTQAQKKAVADLLYACAVGVNMDFSPEGSGAWTEYVPHALVNYFDYDKALRIVYRDYYSLSDWNELVYEELEKYGPVYYAGEGDDGAHAFVCDGYKDGYFHINWGWGGSLDGYYLLSSLFPGTQQGIGGSIGTYNFGQMIIHGVQRPREGSKMVPVVLSHWGYTLKQTTVPVNSTVTFLGYVSSFSTNILTGKFGIIVENSDGDKLYGEGQTVTFDKMFYGFNEYTVKLPRDLADGVYQAYPGFLPEGSTEWVKIEAKRGFPSEFIMTVSNGYAKFTPESTATISINNSEIVGKTFKGKNIKIHTNISNNSGIDYEGIIRLSVRNANDEEVAAGERRFVTVHDGEQMDFNYNSRILSEINAGVYTVGFVDAITGHWISDVIKMNYEVAPVTEIKVDGFYFNGDSNNADPSDLEFILKVNCVKGYFMDSMYLTIWTWPQVGDMTYVSTIYTEDLEIEEGQSVELKLNGKVDNPIIGMRYIVGAWYDSIQYGNSVSFTVASSGTDVIGQDSIRKTEVYDLSGVRVLYAEGGEIDRSQLQNGIYIFKTTKSSGKVETRRIMIR
ncbi:MAG: thiol protease/hemagglutinin PrtT [Muribaculaceae bacterium]|nr:thiol protease/hemagglutinin PrtT [Muribaculaceae bacterium]